MKGGGREGRKRGGRERKKENDDINFVGMIYDVIEL